MRRRLLLLVVVVLAMSGCDDKPSAKPPPFTPPPVATSPPTTHTPSLPPPSTKKTGPVRKWVRGKLTVSVLDKPDPGFPKVQPGLAQVIFTCGYAPKSTQSVLTGMNEPWMNKTKPTGDYLNGQSFSAMLGAFGPSLNGEEFIFSKDSWPELVPQEDSLPLPEISTAYQVRREKLTAASLLKVKAVYTSGCMSDLKPGLPADVEIWAPWDWEFELPY